MDRWQDDDERRARIVGLLSEVDRFRRQLEAAEALAAATDLEPWARRRADDRLPGARKGLDASIYIALADVAKPPAQDVADAAAVPLEYVEAVRERIERRRY
jgi:hypothetical protein